MSAEKKKKRDNRIPSFATYEKRKILRKAKTMRNLVLRKKTDEVVAGPKEQGTLKTSFGVLKEAWTKTGKDFKRLVVYKFAASVLDGLSPYVQSLIYGSLTSVVNGSVQGAAKFFGAAVAEVARKRVSDICTFKAVMAERVLNNTHSNAVLSSIFKDILHKPRPYFKKNAPASLSSVAGQIASAKNKLLNSSMECYSKAIVFGISSASLLAVNPKLAAGVLGVLAFTTEFGGYMNGAFRKFEDKLRLFTNRISRDNNDSIQNTPLVQDTIRVESETQTMKNRLEKSSYITQKTAYSKSRSWLKARNVMNIAMEGLIMAVAFADVVKTGDIGRFALVSGAAWQMMRAGNGLSDYWMMMQAGTYQLIDASKKLITPKELDRVVGKAKLSEKDTKIRVENACFAYPIVKDVTDMSLAEVENRARKVNYTEMILDNLNVEFDKGELTAVIGTSGNGKSTLMSLIRHDYDVQEGDVYIGNKEIRELSDEALNAQIAFVDQSVHFFDDSIEYNLKYFKPDATEEELREACRKACFDMDVDKFKNGMKYLIGQDGSQLSGGQRQRLALARVFLMDKPIIIFDEPTTGLDATLSLRVMQSLKELAKEKTVIMVTHNPTEVALADRVVAVEKGKIIADGKPENLVKAGKISREILTLQDIKNKRKQYQVSIHGENPMREVAELVGAEDNGYVLSDAERMKKRRLLEKNKRLYVAVRKNALKTRAEKEKSVPQSVVINVAKRQGKEYA